MQPKETKPPKEKRGLPIPGDENQGGDNTPNVPNDPETPSPEEEEGEKEGE